jgi:hypothetical protein
LFTLGRFFKIKSSPHFRATFSAFKPRIKSDKNVLGHILGDFFTNSSGHPGHGQQQQLIRRLAFGIEKTFVCSTQGCQMGSFQAKNRNLGIFWTTLEGKM